MIPIHHNQGTTAPVSPAEVSSFRALRTGRLSSEERAELREHLYSVVQATPAPVSPTIFSVWQTLFIRQAWAGAALAVVFVLTGSFGIVRAAETALPGETLYPFKVRVNEPVVGLLRRDRESRAAWERERAERRMQEAEVLLESGRLSESENAAIDELLTEHRRTLQKYSDESDEDFLLGTNRGRGRVKVEIEEENGERRYTLVRHADDEEREYEGDEDEDRSGKEADESHRADDDEERQFESESGDDSSVGSGGDDDVRLMDKDSAEGKSSSSEKARSTKPNASEVRNSSGETSEDDDSSGKDEDEEEKDAEKDEEPDEDKDDDEGKDTDEEDKDNSGSGGSGSGGN